MNRQATGTFLCGVLAALVMSAVFASAASAGPAWKFNEKELTGTETIVGAAEKSGLTLPGMTTTCTNFLYEIDILNKGGTGEGSVTELPLFDCYTNTKCTVTSIEAQSLPWQANLVKVSTSNYITVKGIDVDILYGNKLCVLNGFVAEVKGSAGGLIDNGTQSATFSPSSFTATGTSLEAFGNEVEWNGFFPSEAFEWHREETLSVS